MNRIPKSAHYKFQVDAEGVAAGLPAFVETRNAQEGERWAKRFGHKLTLRNAQGKHHPLPKTLKQLTAPDRVSLKPNGRTFAPSLGDVGSWVHFLRGDSIVYGQVWAKTDRKDEVWVADGVSYHRVWIQLLRVTEHAEEMILA